MSSWYGIKGIGLKPIKVSLGPRQPFGEQFFFCMLFVLYTIFCVFRFGVCFGLGFFLGGGAFFF